MKLFAVLTMIFVALFAQAQPDNYGFNQELAQRYHFEVLNYSPAIFEGKSIKEVNIAIDGAEFKVNLVKVSRVYRGDLQPGMWVEIKRPTGASVENERVITSIDTRLAQMKGLPGLPTVFFCQDAPNDFAHFEITRTNKLPKFRFFREDWVSTAGEEYNGRDTIPHFFVGPEVTYKNRESFYAYLSQIPNVKNIVQGRDYINPAKIDYTKLPYLETPKIEQYTLENGNTVPTKQAERVQARIAQPTTPTEPKRELASTQDEPVILKSQEIPPVSKEIDSIKATNSYPETKVNSEEEVSKAVREMNEIDPLETIPQSKKTPKSRFRNKPNPKPTPKNKPK
jgi:hypothetical protein